MTRTARRRAALAAFATGSLSFAMVATGGACGASSVSSETSVRGLFAVGDMSRHRGGTPSLKQIYTAQEYAVRAVQAIDRRERAARRARVLESK